MKGHMQDGKFHPHTEHKKGVRKSRDQQTKTQGVKVERKARLPVTTDNVDNQIRESGKSGITMKQLLSKFGVSDSFASGIGHTIEYLQSRNRIEYRDGKYFQNKLGFHLRDNKKWVGKKIHVSKTVIKKYGSDISTKPRSYDSVVTDTIRQGKTIFLLGKRPEDGGTVTIGEVNVS